MCHHEDYKVDWDKPKAPFCVLCGTRHWFAIECDPGRLQDIQEMRKRAVITLPKEGKDG